MPPLRQTHLRLRKLRMACSKVFRREPKSHQSFVLALGCIALAAWSSSAHGATLSVCKSGCPYTSIQAAINSANANDVIQVGAGTFFENIVISKSLTILGAGEDDTVIDGSFKGAVITELFGATTLSIVGVTVTHGSQGGIVVSNEKFTLKNSTVASNFGPGVLLSSVNTTISGSMITHNENRSGSVTVNGVSIGANGGGIGTLGDLGLQAYITIENSSILRNTSPSGGGIFADENQNFSVSGSTIADNTAKQGGGGGVFVTTRSDKTAPGGSLNLDSSTVENNHANTDGGGICGSATITNSVIARNTAVHNGGGIGNSDSCGNPNSPEQGDITASNTAFSKNTAGNDGGGLSSAGAAELNTVVISGNQAGKIGGGIFGNTVTSKSVFIVQNVAKNYGGVSVNALFPVGPAPWVITANTPNNCSSANGCPNP
jgi:predicted outer membrane repeat protein